MGYAAALSNARDHHAPVPVLMMVGRSLSRAHSSFADHFGGTRLQSQLLWTAALQVQAQALPVALHALGVVPAPLARRCTALPLCEGARWAAAVCVLYLAASARALANAAPLLRSCFDTFGVY